MPIFDKTIGTLRLVQGEGKQKMISSEIEAEVHLNHHRANWAAGQDRPGYVTIDATLFEHGGPRAKNGGVSPVREPPIYKQHRIHTSRLPSGPWIALIVNLGRKTVPTRDALTDTVTRVPGEYTLEDQAIQTARAYIDHEVRDVPE